MPPKLGTTTPSEVTPLEEVQKVGKAIPNKKPKVPPKTPVPVQPEALNQYDTPTNPKAPSVFNPTLPDRLMLAGLRTKQIFTDSVTPAAVAQVPDTLAYTGIVKNDEVLTAVTTDVTSFFAQVYGNDYMAQLVAAESLPEPQRSRTIAAMQSLAGMNPTITMNEVRIPGQVTSNMSDPHQLIQQAISDPSSVQDMNTEDQIQVRSVASELVGTLQELPDTGVSGDIRRAIAIGTSGNVRLALSQQDIETLDMVVSQLSGLKIGGTTEEVNYAPGRDVGIEQIRQLGEGVLVLDLEDAKADPARAFAVRTYIESNYPELEIEYGREGIVGSLIDKISIPLDYVTAPLGAGLRQVSEVTDRARTPEERKAWLAKADEIEEAIQTDNELAYNAISRELAPVFDLAGGVDPNKDETWKEQASRAVIQLRDYGTEDVGFGEFADQVVENTRPQQIGFGFADSITKATDVLPGDSWYGAAYMGSGLLGAVVLDPFNWGPALLGGLKAARVIPKLKVAEIDRVIADAAQEIMEASGVVARVTDTAGAERVVYNTTRSSAEAAARAAIKGTITEDAWYPIVGRGWIKNSVYRRFAKFPEEIITTKPFVKATERLWNLKNAVGEEQMFAAISRWAGESFRHGGGTETAKLISQATSKEDMGLSLTRAILGMDNPGVPMDQFISEIDDITRRLNADAVTELAPALPGATETRGAAAVAEGVLLPPSPLRLSAEERAALVARRAHLEDVTKGREFVRPVPQIFSAKQMRQIERLADAPSSVWNEAWNESIGFLEKFPGNIRQYLTPAAGHDDWRQPLIAFENMYKDTGGDVPIVLPHIQGRVAGLRLPKGIIAENAVEDSFNALANIGRTLGLSDTRINEIMGGWSGLINDPSAARGYDFLREAWTTMVDESPRLPSFGKADLKTMWKGHSSDRSPSWLSVADADGAHAAPVVYREVVDPVTGQVSRIGKPAIEADQLTVWRTPSTERLREYLTMTQSTMKKWSKAGWTKSSIAGVHHGVTTTWSAINNFWRTSVLGFRLFGALPARIFNEQMLRIAAYDYASAVWHPLEWFYSTHAGAGMEGAGFTTLFREHPGSALGVMVDALESHPGFAQIKAGREIVDLSDGPMFFRSYSERLSRFWSSPSTNAWHMKHLGDTEVTLAEMRGRVNGADWLRTYDEYGMDSYLAVSRTQEEMTQLIGKVGPKAAEGDDIPDAIRTLMRRGEVEIDGKLYRAGTSDLAEKLEDLKDSGRWTPGAEYFNRSAGDYLPLQREGAAARFRDWMFRTFYTAPDLALSRSPMYRQAAAREFSNLLGKGYSASTARRLANAHAARATADMMFTIGAKTSGEVFLRNVNPFFPAYRELATTWLKRIPLRIGEGHWALGSAAIVRRADIWMDFFKQTGLVREDAEGNLVIPLGFMAPVLRLVTGTDVKFNVFAPLPAIAGILPVPANFTDRDEQGNLLPWSERVKGVFPTLGGPSAFILGKLNDILPSDIGTMTEDFLTLYGTDSSLGPMAVDRMFEAFGITPPWMTSTTMHLHETMRTWAAIDGQRLAWPGMIEEFGPPPDGHENPKEAQAWAEEWIRRGEHYAMTTYLLRGVTSMTLPFSVSFEDEGKAQVGLMWDFLNSLPQNDDGKFQSAYIRSYLAANPQLQPYMTGKTLDTRTADDPTETFQEFMDAVSSGEIKIRAQSDWSVFALGSQVMQNFQARRNEIYQSAGNPAEQIVDMEAQAELDQIDREEKWYLDYTVGDLNWLPGQTQSFKDMWEVWQHYNEVRDGKTTPRLSVEQKTIYDISSLEGEFAKYFSSNPETSDEYYKLKDQVYGLLDYQPTSALGQAKNWYFSDVQSTYYDKLDKLYHPGMEAADYQKVRDLANKYNHVFSNAEHPEWGEFPSPEEYAYSKLDPKGQEREVANWATLPGYFLTEFQREQVGYTIDPKKQDAANELANFVTENEIEFDDAVDKYNISTGSTAYEINRAKYDKAYADKAQNLGLGDYWREQNAPEYVRVGKALNLGEQTQTWGLATKRVQELTHRVETTPYDQPPYTQFYSASGSSDVAEKARAQMNSDVRQWRKNDSEFDRIISELQVWMGDEGQPLTQDELVDVLFFDVWQG